MEDALQGVRVHVQGEEVNPTREDGRGQGGRRPGRHHAARGGSVSRRVDFRQKRDLHTQLSGRSLRA